MKTSILQHNITFLPDNFRFKNRLEIKSAAPDGSYTVAQKKTDNTWACSCREWKDKCTCEHLSDLAPLLNTLNDTINKRIN